MITASCRGRAVAACRATPQRLTARPCQRTSSCRLVARRDATTLVRAAMLTAARAQRGGIRSYSGAASAAAAAAPEAAVVNVHRADYRPAPFAVSHTSLDFRLYDASDGGDARPCEVTCTLTTTRQEHGASLVLHGNSEMISLKGVWVDGRQLGDGEYTLRDAELELPTALFPTDDRQVEVTTRVQLHPQRNTELMGLYKSAGLFTTQCEAEGFRNIAYALDRPDVRSTWEVRISAPRASCPVLLSNGNLNGSGTEEGDESRHWVRWVDPHAKPTYLFALVAGDLDCFKDTHITSEGREVALRVYADHGRYAQCAHAMRSLKKALLWEEERWGMVYDLDRYNIVAVDSFIFGAMENQGLNIFNSKYVLADAETATDARFEQIESIIGHEAFHQWSGNRVGPQSWFELTLKEGLTVFRDNEFSADMGLGAVKRIESVDMLRSAQFPEDAGPGAHPVRPDTYVTPANFYTTTVYEKGAEIVRMLYVLLSPEGFRRGFQHYIEKHSYEAVTTEDFTTAMAEANGVDLSQHLRWLSQRGTPVVKLRVEPVDDEVLLHAQQESPDGSPPLYIPISCGLLSPEGTGDVEFEVAEHDGPVDEDLERLFHRDALSTCDSPHTRLLHLRQASQTFRLRGSGVKRAVLSPLRCFSAPVRLELDGDGFESQVLRLSSDTDAWNRFDASRTLLSNAVDDRLTTTTPADTTKRLATAFSPIVRAARTQEAQDAASSPRMLAQLLTAPAVPQVLSELVARHGGLDPVRVAQSVGFVWSSLASELCDEAAAAYAAVEAAHAASDSSSADAVAQRSLLASLLSLRCSPGWSWGGDCIDSGGKAVGHVDEAVEAAADLVSTAELMTLQMAGLSSIAPLPTSNSARSRALEAFESRWRHEPLVLDNWFRAQTQSAAHASAVSPLLDHPGFDWTIPNRVFTLGGFFFANPAGFHTADGAGYEFLADVVLKLDGINPQVAARLGTAFDAISEVNEPRWQPMHSAMQRILGQQPSKDVVEVVGRAERAAAAKLEGSG